MSESSTRRSPQSNSHLLPNQKLRTTCNACQQAKIRCSHTHPCERCESHGYQCIYSISQPLGRPAKKKTTRTGSAATAGGNMRNDGGEVVDRSTRRSAGRVMKSAPAARARRARKVLSRIPSPGTPSGSGCSEREESHRSDSGIGTEVTPPEQDFQWPSLTDWFSDIPEEHTPADQIQCQDFIGTNEPNLHFTPGLTNTNLDSSSERMDGYESSGGCHCTESHVSYSTLCSTPRVGMVVDAAPFGVFNPMHAAVTGTQSGPFLHGGAIYPFSLAPNAIQISGTVQDPARIMELPSNEFWQEPLDPDFNEALLAEEIQLETLPEDTSSLHCNCYIRAFSEVVRSEDTRNPHGILLHLERVQRQGVITLQCPVCYSSTARANILTLLTMAIEKAARALKVRARLATSLAQGGIHSVWGLDDLDQMRRCLSHLSIIVRFIHHDLERAAPSEWHSVMADETDRRLQSIIRIFE